MEKSGPGNRHGQVVYLSAQAWMPYRLQSAVRWSRSCAPPSINPKNGETWPWDSGWTGSVLFSKCLNTIQVTIYSKVKQELCTALINQSQEWRTWPWDSGLIGSVLYSKSLNAIQVTSQGKAGVVHCLQSIPRMEKPGPGTQAWQVVCCQQKLEYHTGYNLQ